jgi:uncharacterized protein (TIGR02147 family)
MNNVFDFNDYKVFLAFIEDSRKVAERGFRRRLAEAVGCQSGYISQVLNTDAHFSLEQGLKIAGFLGLTGRERKALILLIESARAGTQELKAYFSTELASLREEHLNIKERVGSSRELTEREQATYYSSWHYLAVHMLSTIPGFDEPQAFADALRLPLETVNEVVLSLLQTGILEENKGRLKSGLTQVHLNRDSPLIRQHHTNWRLAAIESLTNNRKSDVHYSTVSTLSMADAEKLRAEMVKLIESYVEVVKPSKEETMVGFNLDFYSLIG